MLRKIVSVLIVLPIAIALIIFAVANRGPVTVSLDPFAPETPALAFTVPMFLIVFAAVALGVILGGVAVWFGQGRHRKASRENRWKAARYEREASERRAEVERLMQTPALPAPARSRRTA